MEEDARMRFGGLMKRLDELARELGYLQGDGPAEPIKRWPKGMQPRLPDVRLPYRDDVEE